jgi:hypothetical protein
MAREFDKGTHLIVVSFGPMPPRGVAALRLFLI